MQTGTNWQDGEQIAQYVFNSSTASQSNIDAQAIVDGNKIIATYPVAELAALGKVWKWQAVTSIEGDDIDTAPNTGDDFVNPKKATLGE